MSDHLSPPTEISKLFSEMGKKKIVSLNTEQRAELEKGYRKGKSHPFRLRCQMILLKAENRTSLEVAEFLGVCEVVINNWVQRFEAEGIKGLETRLGGGRPPMLSQQNLRHLQKVKDEIKKHPNSVKMVTDSHGHERGSSHGRWVLKERKKKIS